MSSLVYDVIIIGGGTAGVYCAWRLMQMCPLWRVLVLEREDEVGGRLLSRPGEATGGTAMEFGAMRFFPADHPRVTALLRQLGIPTVEVTQQTPDNLVVVRDVRIRSGDLVQTAPHVYRLLPDEVGKSTDQLVARAQAMGSGQQQQGITFTEAMKRVGTSNEALTMYKDVGGYSFDLDDESAATAFVEHGIVDTSAATTSSSSTIVTQHMVVGGFQRLVRTLAERVTCATGCDVVRLSQEAGRGVTTGQGRLTTVDYRKRDTGAVVQAFASRLVLAIPYDDAMRLLLASTSLNLSSPGVAEALTRGSLGWSACKVFVEFDRAWWSPAWLGRNVTDAQPRQVWFGEAIAGGPRNALVYAGSREARLWRALCPYDDGSQRWHDAAEVPSLAQRTRQEMIAMFGSSTVGDAQPVRLRWRYWHSAAWFWRAGDVDRRRRALTGGEVAPGVWLTGSCYGILQGWVEGALQTAEATVQQLVAVAASKSRLS